MKKSIFISSVLAAAFVMTACGDLSQPAQKSFIAMDTYMTVTAYGENASAAVKEAEEKISSLDALWSVTDENSEISRINRSGGLPSEISAETSEILGRSLEISEITGGALDCTVYPVLTEWGFTTGEYKIPDKKTIEDALLLTGYEKVSLDGDTVTLPDGMKIDFGALGKGAASAAAAKILRENGVNSALLDLGGNIRVIGKKPDGSDWHLGIRSPFDDGIIGGIAVSDCAAVSSGGYERYFVGSDGETYCHIIDPETGRPAKSGLSSVTVIGNDDILCDGLSTALYVLGAEKAAELWRKRDDFEMILVTDEKDILITEGISDVFSIDRGHTDMDVRLIKR